MGNFQQTLLPALTAFGLGLFVGWLIWFPRRRKRALKVKPQE